MSHYWECMKLAQGHLSDFHGKKVGVATLIIMEEYEKLASLKKVIAHRETPDWEDIYRHYGVLADEVRALNTPDTITDAIEPRDIEKNWNKICEIVHSVPSRAEIYAAMKRAGCATTVSEIAVTEELKKSGFKYHPYMRRRLSLMRLKNMLSL